MIRPAGISRCIRVSSTSASRSALSRSPFHPRRRYWTRRTSASLPSRRRSASANTAIRWLARCHRRDVASLRGLPPGSTSTPWPLRLVVSIAFIRSRPRPGWLGSHIQREEAPMAKLRFGYFIAPFHRAGTNPTLALQRDLEFAQHLDALGFDEVWYGEHHSAGSEIISSPEIFIAAAAERVVRIRFGTGVISLAYHNPLWVAA